MGVINGSRIIRIDIISAEIKDLGIDKVTHTGIGDCNRNTGMQFLNFPDSQFPQGICMVVPDVKQMVRHGFIHNYIAYYIIIILRIA